MQPDAISQSAPASAPPESAPRLAAPAGELVLSPSPPEAPAPKKRGRKPGQTPKAAPDALADKLAALEKLRDEVADMKRALHTRQVSIVGKAMMEGAASDSRIANALRHALRVAKLSPTEKADIAPLLLALDAPPKPAPAASEGGAK
jgi:hypothetical protein